jgi:hypothetical protein
MNQKLADWASIAEIASGVAIVVTLIFLIVGIRENTDVIRASAYDRSLQSLIDWRASILQDPDAVRVFEAFYMQSNVDISTLSSEDRARLQLIAGAQWVAYEKSYFARNYGLLGEAEWNRFIGAVCLNYHRNQRFWNQTLTQFITEEFSVYVVDTCEETVQ